MSRKLTTDRFYGRMLRKHQVVGFCLSESQYQSRSVLPSHSHQSPYLGFVLDGRYTETYGRSVRSYTSSTLVYHPAGELHEQHFDSSVRLFRIELKDERIAKLGLPERKLEEWHSRNHLRLDLIHRLYREFCQPDEVSHLAIEGLCLELTASVARRTDLDEKTSRCVPVWLQRAHELIKSSFLEQLTLRDVARAVQVHPVTLAREFRHHYGCTLGGMVRGDRLEFARRELLKTHKTLAEVAISAGFYDQSHFAKAFKRHTGMTPGQYRARFKVG